MTEDSGKKTRADASGEDHEIPLASSRSNAVTRDKTYGALRGESRVVMRHNIALNLDAFTPATESFQPRPNRQYPPLQPIAPPFFSVIIPNYNGMAHLPDLFAGLAQQTFSDFEILFADDASTDASVEWVETHAPQARVVVNRTNQGFAATVNEAATVALGRVIVLLNNDTQPEAGFLAALAQTVCTHPRAGVVAAKLLLFDEPDRLHSAGDLMGRDGIPRNRGVWAVDQGQFDQEGPIFGACGGAMAVRKELWDALGGFDEAFWMYLEDVDFSFRARLLGWDVVFAPQARVLHKLGSSGGDVLSSFYVGRNTLWTLAKNMPARLLWRRLPTIVAGQLQIAADAVRHWRGQAARSRLRGQAAGLLGLPRVLARRRRVQARRLAPDEQIENVLF